MYNLPLAEKIAQIAAQTNKQSTSYQVVFFRLSSETDRKNFTKLIYDVPDLQVFDTIRKQIKELIKCLKPIIALAPPEILDAAVEEKIGNTPLAEYGVWVYYPWSKKLVHLLDEEEFIVVRTNRNKLKITQAEQEILATKKIGVMGLSVGQSVSMTLAMERGFGELRIADFDTLDLSNLNRIRTGTHHIGIPKTIIVAREIAEIDPFLKVTCFHQGITESNIHQFLTENGKLDLLIDECDSFDVKINARKIAKSLEIPVLMEGSDRCTIDIERFDLEPERAILHGNVAHLDMDKYQSLTSFDQRIPYITAVTGLETLSPRMKASAIELMSTISTWPQLASAVTYGGGVSADLSRKILLNHLTISGRYFLDLDEIFCPQDKNQAKESNYNWVQTTLTKAEVESYIQKNQNELKLEQKGIELTEEQLLQLIEAAKLAPSGGNNQPWHWHYQNQTLHLLLNENEALAYLDPDFISSYQSMGAAIENLLLAAAKLQLHANWKLTSDLAPKHIALFNFELGKDPSEEQILLEKQIPLRHTNRKSPPHSELVATDAEFLKKLVHETPGAHLQFVANPEKLKILAEIAAFTDSLRMTIPEAHEDFIQREMRWTKEQVLETENGIGIHTLDLNNSGLLGHTFYQDKKMVDFLKEINGGSAYNFLLQQQFASASAVGLISMPQLDTQNLINCGIASERMWLGANAIGLQIHPMNIPLLFFYKNSIQKNIILASEQQAYLMKAEQTLLEIFEKPLAPIFMFRIFNASPSPERTIRKSNSKILSIGRAN
jgi:molybdopterin/thiamine biosynthesis adenylyltransferase/nitroreductase